jgi:hypothetical protein
VRSDVREGQLLIGGKYVESWASRPSMLMLLLLVMLPRGDQEEREVADQISSHSEFRESLEASAKISGNITFYKVKRRRIERKKIKKKTFFFLCEERAITIILWKMTIRRKTIYDKILNMYV